MEFTKARIAGIVALGLVLAGVAFVLVPKLSATAVADESPRAAAASPKPPPVEYFVPVLGATGKVTRTAALPTIDVADFQNALLPDTIKDGRGVRLGSIGSGLFPVGDDEYWTVTDRGPNPEIVDDVRTFVVPEFDPMLVRIKVKGNKLEIIESIPVTDAKGKPVTGMPNRAFGEESVPLAADGRTVLPYNINGLDPEGIVRTADGHFWISDEYAPSILELDAKGRILKRHLPAGTEGAYRKAGVTYPVEGSLPSALQYRKANRGLEDVALLPDGRTLAVALQSSIVVPGQKDRIVTELLTFDTRTGKTLHEFPYQFDDPSTFNDRGRKLKISALVPVDQTRVIVQERTDFVSRYYLVELNPADDLIAGTDKKLVVDLAGVEGVPDKIEGAALTSPNTLVLTSDDDFGLVQRPYADGENVEYSGARTKLIEVRLAK